MTEQICEGEELEGPACLARDTPLHHPTEQKWLLGHNSLPQCVLWGMASFQVTGTVCSGKAKRRNMEDWKDPEIQNNIG